MLIFTLWQLMHLGVFLNKRQEPKSRTNPLRAKLVQPESNFQYQPSNFANNNAEVRLRREEQVYNRSKYVIFYEIRF